MKKMWNNYLKDAVILYGVIYTFTTIVNSIVYLCDGIYEDPNGNWHELDRAVIVLIDVLAYELIKYIPIHLFYCNTAEILVTAFCHQSIGKDMPVKC